MDMTSTNKWGLSKEPRFWAILHEKLIKNPCIIKHSVSRGCSQLESCWWLCWHTATQSEIPTHSPFWANWPIIPSTFKNSWPELHWLNFLFQNYIDAAFELVKKSHYLANKSIWLVWKLLTFDLRMCLLHMSKRGSVWYPQSSFQAKY